MVKGGGCFGGGANSAAHSEAKQVGLEHAALEQVAVAVVVADGAGSAVAFEGFSQGALFFEASLVGGLPLDVFTLALGHAGGECEGGNQEGRNFFRRHWDSAGLSRLTTKR